MKNIAISAFAAGILLVPGLAFAGKDKAVRTVAPTVSAEAGKGKAASSFDGFETASAYEANKSFAARRIEELNEGILND